MAANKVPQGVIEQSQDRPLGAVFLDAKAVAQITRSFSLNWPALVQRFLPTVSEAARSLRFTFSPVYDQSTAGNRYACSVAVGLLLLSAARAVSSPRCNASAKGSRSVSMANWGSSASPDLKFSMASR